MPPLAKRPGALDRGIQVVLEGGVCVQSLEPFFENPGRSGPTVHNCELSSIFGDHYWDDGNS